jgi:hypothetical protein
MKFTRKELCIICMGLMKLSNFNEAQELCTSIISENDLSLKEVINSCYGLTSNNSINDITPTFNYTDTANIITNNSQNIMRLRIQKALNNSNVKEVIK